MTTEYNEMGYEWVKAVAEYEAFEKTHFVFWANIAEILLNNDATDKDDIREFCDTLEINNTKLRSYLYNFNYGVN